MLQLECRAIVVRVESTAREPQRNADTMTNHDGLQAHLYNEIERKPIKEKARV